jgi:hypothetical protein
MIEVTDILRLHGPAYRQHHFLLPSQQKVLEELVRCRTVACGGQLYRCDRCGDEHYSYHSCGNRHCPKCHHQQTERWLEQQRARLLPCAYYLGRYVFRVAITNSRIEGFDQGQVTFRYRDNRSQQLQRVNLSAEEFIGRFFLHVLPRRFVKVRSYGLFSSNSDAKLRQARALLEAPSPQPARAPSPGSENNSLSLPSPAPRLCPRCRSGHLILIASLLPQRTRGP